MLHGARNPHDAYGWDGNFERQLYDFMEPFFKYAFIGAADIDKRAQDWLSHNCPAPEKLAESPEFLAEFSRSFAGTIINGVFRMKSKPGQLLSMLGLAGDDAKAEGWPEPAKEHYAEGPDAAETPMPAKRPGRKKKARGAAANLTLDTAYLKTVSASGSYTPKMLGAALGITPLSIKKAIEGGTPGVSVLPENAGLLVHELRQKGEELTNLAAQLQNSIAMVVLQSQMAGA